MEVSETGITATQVRKDLTIWAVAGVEIVLLLVVTWKDVANGGGGGGGGPLGEEDSESDQQYVRDIDSIDIEVYEPLQAQGMTTMRLVMKKVRSSSN